MKRRLVRPVAVVCCLCLSSSVSMAQTTAQTPQQATASPAASLSTSERPILEDSTPVKLRISQTISSADAKEKKVNKLILTGKRNGPERRKNEKVYSCCTASAGGYRARG